MENIAIREKLFNFALIPGEKMVQLDCAGLKKQNSQAGKQIFAKRPSAW